MKRIALILFGDFVAFWLALFLTIIIRFPNSNNLEILGTHFLPFLILYIFWTLMFYLFGLYDLFSIRLTIPGIKRFSLAIIISFVLGLLFFYLIPIFGIAPKTNLILQTSIFALFSFSTRRTFYSLLSKKITRPVILIGTTPYLKKLEEAIINNPQLGLKIISLSNDLHKSLDKYGEIENSVFIFEKNSNEISNKDILNLCKNRIEIIDVAEAYERYFYKIPIGYIIQNWVVENLNKRQNIFYNLISRIIDIIFSIIVLIVSSPILMIAIVARLVEDGKPIFIKQKRVGKNGKLFNLYKIRSMISLFPGGLAEPENNPKWATEKDSRITPLGKILRKTHIDEIPQMINILKGDITLVGPRPEHPKFVTDLEQSIPYYELRHIIKPGFTGWAQIKYRYARTIDDSKEKFEYDLYYIKNRNIFMDLGIILRTIQIIFTH